MDFSYTFPPVHEDRLDNGLTVIWVPHREQNVFTIALQVPAGKFSDPSGQEGTAELALGLMQKGTQELDAEMLAEKLEFAGASLYSDVGDEHILIGCRMLAKYSETIIPLFWEIVTKPGFREKELSRLKKEMITALQAELVDPASIANRHFYAEILGREQLAGRGATGKSIKRVSLGSIRSFYGSFVIPSGSTVVLAGDAAIDQMKSRWVGLFRSWKNPAQQGRPVRCTTTEPAATTIRLLDKPDLSQTSLLFGHPVPGEYDNDHEPLAIANYILGGGNFSSRLMSRVRVVLGNTYNINSQILCNRQFGIFMIATSTQNSQAGEVLRTILDVYNDISKNGITSDELEKAKQFATGNMAFQLEGIGNV
ncbi:MAG: hypothetical protein GF350_12260, partial [Chitinivibrionales bacterium]|nr:hypothetical protein [Chitinivibrionales bacterium]